MEENTTFHKRYKLTRLLGRGAFSEVWLACDTLTQTDVALKIYAPSTGLDSDGLNLFAREFSMVVNARHAFLLRPLHYDTFERMPYLVLPYQANGSTQCRVGLFQEKEAWRLLHDVASALAYLHDMNPPVIHQDIKPANILEGDNGDYLLTDFGVSAHCRSVLRQSVSKSFSSAGTIAYMAPERFDKTGYIPIMASDIYSLGATAFELVTGSAPFGENGGLAQRKGVDVPELPSKFSADLRKVVCMCMSINPWERPTAAQLAKMAEQGMNGNRVRLSKGRKQVSKTFYFLLPVILMVAMVLFCKKQCSESGPEKPEMQSNVSVDTLTETIDSVFETCIDTLEADEPSPHVRQTQTQPKQEKRPARSSTGSISLKYGTYHGVVDNQNRPDFDGVITVTSATDFCGYAIYPGYKIKTNHEHGQLINAEIYDEAGNIVHTVCP